VFHRKDLVFAISPIAVVFVKDEITVTARPSKGTAKSTASRTITLRP